MMETEQKICLVAQSTDSPCPYVATESLPHKFGDDAPHLCAFHAATEPLVEESNDLAASLDLLRTYLKGARNHPAAGPLVAALERVDAGLVEREELVDKVLDDLHTAERKLMR